MKSFAKIQISLGHGLLILRVLAAFALTSVTAFSATSSVEIDSGIIRGYPLGKTLVFKGIPYAAPPVGPLRWRAPQPVAKWAGIRSAQSFGNECTQNSLSFFGQMGGDASGGADKLVGNEDCLFLNVWTPADASVNERLPVMVYLHGGSNLQGASSSRLLGMQIYDGQKLSETGRVIVVTLNYRLGSFGFLPLQAFAAEDPKGIASNFGLLDQIAALEWVRRNIAAFGGDASRVTLFGESAGAFDSLLLYASPTTRGLFSGVILQSAFSPNDIQPLAVEQKRGQRFAESLGCRNEGTELLACLRSKTAAQINAQPTPVIPFAPVIDGIVVLADPLSAIDLQSHASVPLIVGNNADELSYLLPEIIARQSLKWPPTSEADIASHLQYFFGLSDPSAALQRYRTAASPADEELAIAADGILNCRLRRVAVAATRYTGVRYYRYTKVFSASLLKPYGAAHAFELPFVFGNFPPFPFSLTVHITAAERAFSENMMGYWLRFAKTGDPNGGPVYWPPFDPTTNAHLNFDENIQAAEGDPHSCNFWDRNPLRLRVPVNL